MIFNKLTLTATGKEVTTELTITASSDKVIGELVDLSKRESLIILPGSSASTKGGTKAMRILVTGPDAEKFGVAVGDIVIPRAIQPFMIGQDPYYSTRASDLLAILKDDAPKSTALPS